MIHTVLPLRVDLTREKLAVESLAANNFELIGTLKSMFIKYTISLIFNEDRVSSVGIATRYRLEGLGIWSRWERDIPPLSRPDLGPT